MTTTAELETLPGVFDPGPGKITHLTREDVFPAKI